MRRLLVLTAALAVLAFCSSALATPVFYVWGKGWGHGIGMPQYGAQGYAIHGKDYRWILAHFYTGTEPGVASKTTIRALLDVGRSSVTLYSPTAWRIEDSNGKSFQLDAGAKTIGSDFKILVQGRNRSLAPPVTASRHDRPISVGGRPYRGSIVLRRVSGLIAIVNHVGLQAYLQGVVPWEMPASWHPEALKSQAVAARSYGLANTTSGTYFDVYDDTRDQVYGGVDAEQPSTNAAVKATANEVRTYNGNLATTYFYSSSGGRTAASEDSWGDYAIPYLRSVRDRWDTISPYHTWGPTRYSRASLDAALGGYVEGALRDIVTEINPSRRVEQMRMIGTGGNSSLAGWDVRNVLGLRSSWFRVGVLNIAASRKQIESGQPVRLVGKARSVGAAWLERRSPGGSWAKVQDLELTSDARFSTRVEPHMTREYRVNSAKGASDPVRVQVTAKVRFAKPFDRSGLAGVVVPGRAGAKVRVERRAGGEWQVVETGRTDAAGRFSLSFELQNGTYRAVASAPGAARGVSPQLRVVG